ncbi:MAG: hypothetical protein AAGD01_17725 [Acidobacteriota bacterium]
MSSRLLSIAAAAVLCLGMVVPQQLSAGPVHYGTGIYLWVLTCPTGPGSWSIKYVSSSTCPNNAPPNCTCAKTLHDFPVDHPYPTRIAVNDGGQGSSSGTLGVILDSAGAIQCGVNVEPPSEGYGSCGDHFNATAIDEWDVDWELRDAVESLRGDLEDVLGYPVEGFSYSVAEPN